MLYLKAFNLQPVLRSGQKITGRWERNSYRIVRLLGQGGTGLVYLVQNDNGGLRAMKISADVTGITYEHRILVFLNRCGRIKELGIVPEVYELDDFQIGKTVYHYIVTRYCPGTNLGTCLGRLRNRHVAVIGKQVAGFLSRLHEEGFIFGDLKPGNIVYDFPTGKINIIDYGSVSVKGHSLKQYTPGYDRASWQVGTRIADEQYDMFALGILLTALAVGKRELSPGGGLSGLISLVTRRIEPGHLQKTIVKALRQEAAGCREIALCLSVAEKESETAKSGRENTMFVHIVGAASVISFILSLAYYYQ